MIDRDASPSPPTCCLFEFQEVLILAAMMGKIDTFKEMDKQ